MTTWMDKEGNLPQTIDDYDSDPCCQQVLEFLRRHPRTRFSQLAIVRTLNSNRSYIERALACLTASGAIKNYRQNNVPFYSLEVCSGK